MNCRRIHQLLSNHLEGLLPAREATTVAAHLEACPACRRLRNAFAANRAELRELAEPTPPPGLRHRAVQQWIAERETPRGAWRRWFTVPPALPSTGHPAVVLCLLLLAVLGTSVVWWGRDRVEGPSTPQGAGRPPAGQLPEEPRLAGARHPATFPGSKPWERRRLAGTPFTTQAIESPGPSGRSMPATRRRSQRLPVPTPPTWRAFPAARRGDLVALNGNPSRDARPWVPLPADPWDQIEADVRRQVPVRDDFVQISFPRVAAAADREVVAAAESYQREAAVIDTRLSRAVTVQQKATALADLCDRLRADTGIVLTAGSSVADEKVTVFCERRPLRDVMRQLSVPFGYTWLRSGKQEEYKYELVQDLRSQLLEEELRNREHNAALLGLDRELQRYRKYLELSPDEALARAQTAAPEEKRLLEKLAKDGWGPVQMYFRLSPSDFAALKSGQELKFSAEPEPDDWFAPRSLPAEVARGVLQSLRDMRVVRRDDDRFMPTDASDPNGMRLTAVPGARALVTLKLSQSELGQFTLGGGSGYRALRTVGLIGPSGPYAIGQSPTSVHPDNRKANASLAGDPALRRRVSVRPQPSCEGTRRPMPDAHQAQNTGRSIEGEPPSGKPQSIGITPQSQRSDGRSIEGEPPSRKPRVTYADLLEGLHRATGLPIVADAYTRLYEPEAVSLRDQPLFDALNRVADTTRLRWSLADGNWLQFRSASYFNDRLKEVPNRLLARWSASRRQHGVLTLADLAEIAQLSDAQLDAGEMAEAAEECFDLQEWPLAQRWTRPHLRYLAGFTPAQQQAATSSAGLAFRQMSLGQQQQFIQFAFYQYAKRPPTTGIDLGELEGAFLRVAYRQPGEFQWWPKGGLRDAPPQKVAELSLVSGPTREETLQRARRIDPQVQLDGIVPTEPCVIFQYVHRRPLTVRATLNGSSIY